MITTYQSLLRLGVDREDIIDLLAHYLIAETSTYLMMHNGRAVVREAQKLLELSE